MKYEWRQGNKKSCEYRDGIKRKGDKIGIFFYLLVSTHFNINLSKGGKPPIKINIIEKMSVVIMQYACISCASISEFEG